MSMPSGPAFEIVKVPPSSSSDRMLFSRALRT